jgi:septal ring factor EnvC (AmiA/AmiB activator)
MAWSFCRFKSLLNSVVAFVAIVVLQMLLSGAECLAAPSAKSVQLELVRLGDELNQEQQQLAFIRDQIKQLEQAQQKYKQQSDKLKQRLLELDREFQRVGLLLEKELAAYKPVEDSIKEMQGRAVKRIRASYMYGPRGVVEAMFSSGADSIGLVRASHYLGILREKDQELIKQYSTKLATRDQKRAEVQKAKQRKEKLEIEVQDQQQQLQDQATWESDLLLKLKTQKAQADKTVLSLKAKQTKLQSYFDRVTSTSAAGKALRSQLNNQKPKETVSAGFAGQGLVAKKGKLPWPAADSEVLQGFGKYKSPDLGEELFSKGLELNTFGQVAVSAISDGQVIFTGQMPGYGLVVVLDHGQRFYSVYGKLSSLFVAPGDRIKAKDKIAVSSAGAKAQSNLYFEIRENGAALDPRSFLLQR